MMAEEKREDTMEKLDLLVAVAKDQFEEIVSLKEKGDEGDVHYMISYGLAKGWLSQYHHLMAKKKEKKDG